MSNLISHKFLISSPAYFVGENSFGGIKIRHAFEDFTNYDSHIKPTYNMSHHVVEFKTPIPEKKVGNLTPSFFGVGEIISQVLTVIFGKMMLPIGFFESNGILLIPEFVDIKKYNKKLDFYSDVPRKHFPIELNMHCIGDIHLDTNLHEFKVASRLYQNAMLDFPKDPGIAYVNLVNAGEILSSHQLFEDKEIYDNQILELLKEIENTLPNGTSKRNQIISRLKQIKKKYVKGLLRFCDDKIFQQSNNPKPLTKENIEATLAASYDLRSLFLHEGVRISGHVSLKNFDVGLTHKENYSKSLKETLNRAPSFYCLERIVHYALLKRLFSLMNIKLEVPNATTPITIN